MCNCVQLSVHAVCSWIWITAWGYETNCTEPALSFCGSSYKAFRKRASSPNPLVSEAKLSLRHEAWQWHSSCYFLLFLWLAHNAVLIVTLSWTYLWCGPAEICSPFDPQCLSFPNWKNNYHLSLGFQVFITVITGYNDRLHRRTKWGNT